MREQVRFNTLVGTHTWSGFLLFHLNSFSISALKSVHPNYKIIQDISVLVVSSHSRYDLTEFHVWCLSYTLLFRKCTNVQSKVKFKTGIIWCSHPCFYKITIFTGCYSIRDKSQFGIID